MLDSLELKLVFDNILSKASFDSFLIARRQVEMKVDKEIMPQSKV